MLNKQLSLFEEAWSSVSLGEEHIREFVMFSYDVPLSKGFMPRAIAVFNERFRRLLKMHDEFQILPPKLQAEHWNQICFYGSALICAKLENSSNGNEQLKFCIGQMDNDTWSRDYANILPKKLKKLTMDKANEFSGVLPIQDLIDYCEYSKNISSIINSEMRFKVFCMVLLFSEIKAKAGSPLHLLKNNYLNIISRRDGCLGVDDKNAQLAFGRNVYSKINSCIEDVKKLAIIMQKLNGLRQPSLDVKIV